MRVRGSVAVQVPAVKEAVLAVDLTHAAVLAAWALDLPDAAAVRDLT